MQTWDRHQLDFWTAALPDELWRLPEELAQVDRFPDDPAMLAPLAAALDPTRGRLSLPVAQVLRLFYLQHRYQRSDRSSCKRWRTAFTGAGFVIWG